MRPFFVRLVSALVLCSAAACSSNERDIPSAITTPIPPTLGGGTSTKDAGATDGGTTSDASQEAGVSCLPQASFSLDGAFGGNLAIRGTITFPAPLPAQRLVVVSIVAAVGGDPRQQAFAAGATSDRFTYRIGSLISSKYIVRIQADAGGNGAVNDPGDYDGYFNGTASGPILTRADAIAVDVKSDCLDLVDFGAGVKQ